MFTSGERPILKGGIKMKKIAILITLLLLGLPVVLAQDNLNIAVTAGDTLESDMATFDISPDDTLGAVISTIVNQFKRFIEFSGLEIWKNETFSNPAFTAQLWPAGTVINGIVTVGAVWESSESVVLSGRTTTTHVWDTALASFSSTVNQVLNALNVEMTYDDGGTIEVTDFSIGAGIDFILDGTPFSEVGVDICEDRTDICPTKGEVESFFGLGTIGVTNLRVYEPITDITSVLFIVCDGSAGDCSTIGQWSYFIEPDKDQTTHEFSTVQSSGDIGRSVDSFEDNVLAILPSGNWDLYGQVA